jgi:hypothetical protein
MSTFLAAVFAVIFTLIGIGHFIWTIVVAYRGLTWFLTNFDDLPHIWKQLAISPFHSPTHLEAYLQSLIMLSSGIPSPASQHRQHQVVYTIRVWPDFHLRMVRSSTSSRLASCLSVRGMRSLTSWISKQWASASVLH